MLGVGLAMFVFGKVPGDEEDNFFGFTCGNFK